MSEYDELREALGRFKTVRSSDSDPYCLAAFGILPTIDDLAASDSGLWVNALSIEVILAEHRGLIDYEMAMPLDIQKLALHPGWIVFVLYTTDDLQAEIPHFAKGDKRRKKESTRISGFGKVNQPTNHNY